MTSEPSFFAVAPATGPGRRRQQGLDHRSRHLPRLLTASCAPAALRHRYRSSAGRHRSVRRAALAVD